MPNIYCYLDIYDDSDEDDTSVDLNSEYSEESELTDGWENLSQDEEDEEDEEDDGAGVLTPRSRRKLINQLVLS
tara:strand:+ start:719 stop:940 length:222 start_codon:yes stop_codon:yes gene_type:complete